MAIEFESRKACVILIDVQALYLMVSGPNLLGILGTWRLE
jgi:hypothetical protein